ncbi:hypothetical protein [Polaromonas jejuensis]|uniref:Lipoprotein n=1 Tax=Polaromonas jejuensis TaxID=457502 RepID=A0ABW0QCI6_9BURK|nr:hypothetical protein [Polaromonas jejuensis]
MKFGKIILLTAMLGSALMLQGCLQSEADKQADAAKKAVLFQNMYQRGLEERHCDMTQIKPQGLANCWKEADKKWKDVPSAYVGEPPAGVTRSSKPYVGK